MLNNPSPISVTSPSFPASTRSHRINFTPTYQDHRHAQALYRHHRKLHALSYYVLEWLVPALTLAAAIWILWTARNHRPSAPPVQLGILVLIALCIYTAVPRYDRRRRWLRANAHPHTLHFDAEGLSFIRSATDRTYIPWASVIDYAEDHRTALLFFTQDHYLAIPRHALPPEAWSHLRTFAHRSHPAC